MKLLFSGDVNFRGKDKLSFEESKNMLSQIQPILDEADFRIVNLECPLGDKNEYAPILKVGPICISGFRGLKKGSLAVLILRDVKHITPR